MSSINQRVMTIVATLALTADVILTIVQLCMSDMLTGTIRVSVPPFGSVTSTIDIGLFNTCVADQCSREGLGWTTMFPSPIRREWQGIQAFVILNFMFCFVVLLSIPLKQRIESALPNHVKLLRLMRIGFCFFSFLWGLLAFSLLLDITPRVREVFTDLELGVAGTMQLVACTFGMIGAALYFVVCFQQRAVSNSHQGSLLQDQHAWDQGSDAPFEGIASIDQSNYKASLFSPRAVQAFSRPF